MGILRTLLDIRRQICSRLRHQQSEEYMIIYQRGWADALVETKRCFDVLHNDLKTLDRFYVGFEQEFHGPIKIVEHNAADGEYVKYEDLLNIIKG